MRRTTIEVSGKHKVLKDAVKEMRKSQAVKQQRAADVACAVRPRKNPPRGHPLNPVVPKTIENLWSEVEEMYDRRQVDAPLCEAGNCPHCSDPLMEQRCDLMQRLVVLEKLIWLGDKGKSAR